MSICDYIEHMKWIVRASGSILILFLFTCISSAAEMEGRLIALYDRIFLLDIGGGKLEAVFDSHKSEEVQYKNFNQIWDINNGERLKIKYTGEVHGVKMAYYIEADPIVELFDLSASISTEEVKSIVDSGTVHAIVDTRTAEEYEAGHIPTAISMPEFDPEKLPEDKDSIVVFHSQGMRDPSANEAAKKAADAGYINVRVYSGGMHAWLSGKNYTLVDVSFVERRLKEGEPLIIVDTRSKDSIEPEEGEEPPWHIPGAFHVPTEEMQIERLRPVRMLVPPTVFYGEDADDEGARRAVEMALRWKYAKANPFSGTTSNPVNVLKGGFEAWKFRGATISNAVMPATVSYVPDPSTGIISMAEFRKLWKEKAQGEARDKVLLDAREGRPLFMKDLRFVTSIPLEGNLPEEGFPYRIPELSKKKEIVIFCAMGYRAMMAYHILDNLGYRVRYLDRDPMIQPDGTLAE